MSNAAPAAGIVQLQELVLRFINISVRAAFIVLLIMLISAGIKYITSGGDSKSLGKASMTITWSLLGILFLVLAWLILLLVQAFTNVQVTQFCLTYFIDECK